MNPSPLDERPVMHPHNQPAITWNFEGITLWVLTIKFHCCFWIFPQNWCELWMVPYNEDLEKMHLLRQNTKRKRKKKAKLPVYFFLSFFAFLQCLFLLFSHSRYWLLQYFIFFPNKNYLVVFMIQWLRFYDFFAQTFGLVLQ